MIVTGGGGSGGGGGGGGVNAGLLNQIAYYATAGSTVSGSYNNPAFKIYNVLEYGADPTGVANSTTAFQDAIDAAANATLWIPGGTYKLVCPNGSAPNYAITISSPINIVADPSAHMLLAHNTVSGNLAYSSTFWINSDYVYVTGGIWDNNVLNYNEFVNNSNAQVLMFKVGDTATQDPRAHIAFRQMVFLECWCAIITYETSHIWVEDNWCGRTTSGFCTFIHNSTSVTDMNVTGNYADPDPINPFEQLNFLSPGGGSIGMSQINISGNTWNAGDHHAQGGYCNVQLYLNDDTSEAAFYHNVSATNNHFIGGQNTFSTTGCINSTFSDNTMEAKFPNVAFVEVGNNRYCTYSGNVLDGAAPGGINNYAVQGLWETGVSIYITYVGNTIRNVAGNGIQVVAGHKTVTGNQITTDFGLAMNGATGVAVFQEFSTTTNNVAITGNYIQMGGTGFPIQLADAFNVAVVGNVLAVETASNTGPCVLITANTDWTPPYGNIIIKDNIHVSGSTVPYAIGASSLAHVSPNIFWEYPNTDGSVTKYSNGWVGPGTSTQSTNKSTALATGTPSLNVYQLDITMNNAALNAGVVVTFDWPNTLVLSTDVVRISHQSGGTIGAYLLNTACTAGHVSITVTNISAGNLSEAIVLRAYLMRNPDI